MQARRKHRLWIALSILTGLGCSAALVLYALSANIDLFYTPGEILYGKNENHKMPENGESLRVGGYVQPGSVVYSSSSLAVSFRLYDARGVVSVSYQGVLPDLFREGQAVVVQGVLNEGHLIIARQVLAKHDENYTPPEIKQAMTPQKGKMQ